MYNWFKVYHGTMTDPKLAVIAKRSGAKLSEVLCVWLAVLECASSQGSQSGGSRGELNGFDPESVDAILDFEDGTTQRILDAMTGKGMIIDGRVANWDKRQRASDASSSNAERQRRFRERRRSDDDYANMPPEAYGLSQDNSNNAPVTPSNASTVTPADTVTPVTLRNVTPVTSVTPVTPSNGGGVTVTLRNAPDIDKDKDRDKDFKTKTTDKDLARARESDVGVGEETPPEGKARCGTGGTVTLGYIAGLWRDRLEPLGFPPAPAERQGRAMFELFNERVRDNPARASPDWWRELIERIASSKFLRDVAAHGAPKTGLRWITLEWVLKCKDGVPNLDKICDGRFDDARGRGGVASDGGEPVPDLFDVVPDWCIPMMAVNGIVREPEIVEAVVSEGGLEDDKCGLA